MGVLNRAAIKREAKEFIGNDKRWLKMFFSVALYYILTNIDTIRINIQKLPRVFREGNTIKYFFDYYTNYSSDQEVEGIIKISFNIVSILLIPFIVSVAGYFLNSLRGFNPDWKSVCKEGFDNYGSYFVVCIVTGISIFLWSLLFFVPGIIKALEYSQVPYLLHDNKNLKASQAKQISTIMTRDYKTDLLILYLSFIGWHIIGAFTFGLGYIYVIPYINTVKAMYYENLKSNAIDRGLVAPEAFMTNAPVYDGFSSCNQYNDNSQGQIPEQPFTTNNIYSSQIAQPDTTKTEDIEERMFEIPDDDDASQISQTDYPDNDGFNK